MQLNLISPMIYAPIGMIVLGTAGVLTALAAGPARRMHRAE